MSLADCSRLDQFAEPLVLCSGGADRKWCRQCWNLFAAHDSSLPSSASCRRLCSDTLRPINASKKGLFQDLGNSINDGLKNTAISTTVEAPEVQTEEVKRDVKKGFSE